jgi:acetyl-CoA synthetase
MAFDWSEARAALDGLPDGGGLNIAYEALDRHADDRVAIRWLGKDGRRVELTYAALRDHTARFANAMASLGVQAGDAVFGLSGRVPELYVAALGALRAQLVFCPLFSAFGPEPIHVRMASGRAKVLVTTERLYRRKVAAIRDRLPDLAHVVLIDGGSRDTGAPALHERHDGHAQGSDPRARGRGAHHLTGRLALDLHPGDVYWCTADPGWVTGTSYGIIAPLVNGVTMHRRRGRVRRRALVRHPRTQRRAGLVHRADGDPDADAPGVDSRQGRDLRRCASSPASASR